MSMTSRHHHRYPYRPITERPDFRWPGDKRLALYIGLSFEHFHFAPGHGDGRPRDQPPRGVRNFSWYDYGNRVGAWRMLDMFESLGFPVGLIVNSVIADYCPELIFAYRQKLSSEIIAHGRTNSEAQDDFDEAGEAALIADARDRLIAAFGERPVGWLAPWIAESPSTPDLLAEAGFVYHLDWAHDDQPVWMDTRGNGEILSVPYPQEINDMSATAAQGAEPRALAARIVDQFDEMMEQARRQPLVMGIALHPCMSGQPFRLRALRRALTHIAARRRDIWLTTPGQIAEHYAGLFPG